MLRLALAWRWNGHVIHIEGGGVAMIHRCVQCSTAACRRSKVHEGGGIIARLQYVCIISSDFQQNGFISSNLGMGKPGLHNKITYLQRNKYSKVISMVFPGFLSLNLIELMLNDIFSIYLLISNKIASFHKIMLALENISNQYI